MSQVNMPKAMKQPSALQHAEESISSHNISICRHQTDHVQQPGHQNGMLA
jgi:hypothetical protein